MISNNSHRVAVGSLFIECNHLGGVPTSIDFFERSELCRGDAVLSLQEGTVGGMLDTLRQQSAEIAPLLVAISCSSGPLTADCYGQLKTEMLDRLRQSLPVDGVLLALHGSASAENAGDIEGDLLAAVRSIVGVEIPIVATLDLHAHVTEAMVRSANALVAWETYPHRDAVTTGQRGADLLLRTLQGEVKPTMALAKAPVIVGGVHSGTEGDAPFAEIMRFAKSFENDSDVLSTSAFLVHPYLDLPEMGGGGLVITNDNMEKAASIAAQIAQLYWARRFKLEADVYSPAEAINEGLEIEGGPVLLAEVADCCGGGAAGDNVTTLKSLVELCSDQPSLVPVVDPAAAQACHSAGAGGELTLQLGHSLDPQWGSPLHVTGTVAKTSDGTFTYSEGIYKGQTGNMGPSAVFTVGAIQILITTHATYDWADEQFRSMQLDPLSAKFIVVKNPMNFRVGYDGVYKSYFILGTPGSTPATVKHVQFKNLQRPYFPKDTEIPNFNPKVIRSSVGDSW